MESPSVLDYGSTTDSSTELIYPPAVIEYWQDRWAEWCLLWDDSTNSLRSPAPTEHAQFQSPAMDARMVVSPPTPVGGLSAVLINNGPASSGNNLAIPVPTGPGAVLTFYSHSPIMRNNTAVPPSMTPPTGLAAVGVDNGRASPAHNLNTVIQVHHDRSVPTNMPPNNSNIPRRAGATTPSFHYPSPVPHANPAVPSRMPSINSPLTTAVDNGRASPAGYLRTVTPSQAFGPVGSAAPGSPGRQPQNPSQHSMPTNNSPTTPIFVHYVPPKATGDLTVPTPLNPPSASSPAARNSPAPQVLQRSAATQQPTTYFVQVSGPTGKHECLLSADPAVAPLTGIENVLQSDGSPAPQGQGSPSPPPTAKRKRRSTAGDETRPRKKVNNVTANKGKSLRRQATERAAMSAQSSIPQGVSRSASAPSLPVFAFSVSQTPQGLYLPTPPGYSPPS